MTTNLLPKSYEDFKPTVDDIKSGSIEVTYLGGGSESQVFKALIDNTLYAVKFANPYTVLDRRRNTARATQRKIDAGVRGLDVDGLEQIQAASTDDGVAIYNLVKGTTIRSMTVDDLSQITEKQIQSLCETIKTAAAAGIEFDPWNQDGTNVLYSPDTGFVLIDYFIEYTQKSPEENIKNGYKSLGSTALDLLSEKYGSFF